MERIGPLLRPTSGKRLLLAFHAIDYKEPFFQQDMSDGTLKMLAYLLLMEDPDPAPLIGIEEPENGLHHQLLGDLAHEFKEFARKSRPQVIITTHAPNFVDALMPEEVWVLEKGADGYSRLTWRAPTPDTKRCLTNCRPNCVDFSTLAMMSACLCDGCR